MNIIELIQTGAHFVDCGFSNYNIFRNKITMLFDEQDIDINKTKEKISDHIKGVKTNDVFNQKQAEKLLLYNDLVNILENYSNYSSNLTYEPMEKYHSKFVQLLRQLGLNMKLPQIFIVEVFPKPYDKMPWSACAPDLEDYERYGITPGIYFKKGNISPYQSHLVLAHELIHGAVANANPYLLGRGLEEGLCDIVGSAYLCNSVFGFDLTQKMLTYKRLNFPYDQFQETYFDFLKQAYYLLINYGIDGLIFLIKEGRERIKETENNLLLGKFNKINLPKGNYNIELTNLISHVCLTYGKNLCVSPLAVFIYQNISRDDSVPEFCEKFKIPRGEADKAIEELKNRVFLLVSQDDTILYNEREQNNNSKYLRYEFL